MNFAVYRDGCTREPGWHDEEVFLFKASPAISGIVLCSGIWPFETYALLPGQAYADDVRK